MLIVTHEMEFARNISVGCSIWMKELYMKRGLLNKYLRIRNARTKAFIHRVRSKCYDISSKNYDLYKLQGEIGLFCEKHVISQKTREYAQMLAEEVVVMQKDYSDINIMLSYSEKEGTLNLVCESGGEKYNPLEDEFNEIAVMIIRGRCKRVDYSFSEGKNVLTLGIKNE